VIKPLGPAAWLVIVATVPAAACGQQQSDPWTSVGRILKTENVSSTPYHRYNLPRTDMTLNVGGVDASVFGLGQWVGFSGEVDDATMMGDLVVSPAELGAVLSELSRQEVDVTAIHNHLAGASPEVVYVHFRAHGDAADLATRVDRAIALTSTPRPTPAPTSEPVQIDTTLVFRTLGQSGSASGTVARLAFQLVDEPVTVQGRPVDPALAHRTPITVQMVEADRAVASGDFAVRADVAVDVVNALARGGITATAMHSHLVEEQPQLRYIHFWADGSLLTVLEGLRSALDAAR